MIIGIQGGPGSFNEQALAERLIESGSRIRDHRVIHLYTSRKVLEELASARIDWGQFAIFNTLGGEVQETKSAKEQLQFDQQFLVESVFRLPITHSLIAFPGISLSEITQVITHPQVIAQCHRTWSERFPKLEMIEGEGDLVDPARVGQAIAEGELPRTTATVSSARIATAFKLEILASNLQDSDDNFTDFELVRRR